VALCINFDALEKLCDFFLESHNLVIDCIEVVQYVDDLLRLVLSEVVVALEHLQFFNQLGVFLCLVGRVLVLRHLLSLIIKADILDAYLSIFELALLLRILLSE
jgi:hypothetical protein